MAEIIKSGMYEYEWDSASNTMKIRVIKGRAMPTFKIGDLEVSLSTRRNVKPKEYVTGITGKARAIKGFYPQKLPAMCDFSISFTNFNPNRQFSIWLKDGEDSNGDPIYKEFKVSIPVTETATISKKELKNSKPVSPATIWCEKTKFFR